MGHYICIQNSAVTMIQQAALGQWLKIMWIVNCHVVEVQGAWFPAAILELMPVVGMVKAEGSSCESGVILHGKIRASTVVGVCSDSSRA